jgi:hypothetical protein
LRLNPPERNTETKVCACFCWKFLCIAGSIYWVVFTPLVAFDN